jgi:3-hydroxyacyl-CoA dehydrogenase / enoyl-CoA hydratase / 3-hydroxybutyryl-CoA epimerase
MAAESVVSIVDAASAAGVQQIEQALNDPGVTGVILQFTGADAGNELLEIRSESSVVPRLRDALLRLDETDKSSAAVLESNPTPFALEIATACQARFAARTVDRLEFPFLKLGVLPILGTTQRLPRIIGLEAAIRVLLEGESVPPGFEGWFEVGDDPRTAARRFLQDPAKLRICGRPYPVNQMLLQGHYLRLRKRISPDDVASSAMLRLLHDGLERALGAGIRLEAEEARRALHAESTRNRLYVLGEARATARKAADDAGDRFRIIGVVGSGLMGTGIALTAALKGCHVLLYDVSADAIARCLARIRRVVDQSVREGQLSESLAAETIQRVEPIADHKHFSAAEFVVEAVFERPLVKMATLASVSKHLSAGQSLASNTTTLPITELAAACAQPERFVGAHFFAPAERMELLEIIRGKQTSPETIAATLCLARTLGKTPVIVNDGPGFFTSRVVMAYVQEALLMLREGVSPWLIDHVAQNAGMVIGPLTMVDLTSLELLADIFHSLEKHRRGVARDSGLALSVLEVFTSRERFGRKAGAGIYSYDAAGERIDWDEWSTIFPAAGAGLDPKTIEQRLFAIQTVESLRAFHEGIIADPQTADLASVLGWSYPAYRGGVMRYRDQMGHDHFAALCKGLAARFGARFELP